MLGGLLIFYFIVLSALAFAAYLIIPTIGLWFSIKNGPTPAGKKFEFVFCLINPIIYFLLLKPLLIPDLEVYTYFMGFSWFVFLTIWFLRAFGSKLSVFQSQMDKISIWLFTTGLVLAILHLGQDAYYWYKLKGLDYTKPLWVAGLYLLPILILVAYTRYASNPHANLPSNWKTGRVVGFCILALIGFRVGWVPSPSSDRVQQLINENRDTIENAARTRGLNPKLLAATIYIAQTEYGSLLRTNLESLIMSAWIMDSKSHFTLSKTLNISLGLAQVKPTTAQTAIVLYRKAILPEGGLQVSRYWKEHRDVPRLDLHYWRIPAEKLAMISPPPMSKPASKSTIRYDLLSRENNIHYAASILALYKLQWEAFFPTWDMNAKPEILATLYQIGFEKSKPHPEPIANRFGDAVKEAMNLPFIVEAFPETEPMEFDAMDYFPDSFIEGAISLSKISDSFESFVIRGTNPDSGEKVSKIVTLNTINRQKVPLFTLIDKNSYRTELAKHLLFKQWTNNTLSYEELSQRIQLEKPSFRFGENWQCKITLDSLRENPENFAILSDHLDSWGVAIQLGIDDEKCKGQPGIIQLYLKPAVNRSSYKLTAKWWGHLNILPEFDSEHRLAF